MRRMEAIANGADLLTASWTFDGVGLVEPRVAHRGGPKVQQIIDWGHLVVDAQGVKYASATRRREWLFRRLTDWEIHGSLLLMHVSNRTLISGVTADPVDATAIACVVRFVDDRVSGFDGLHAIDQLRTMLLDVERQALVRS